jgi:hypothetical protein
MLQRITDGAIIIDLVLGMLAVMDDWCCVIEIELRFSFPF